MEKNETSNDYKYDYENPQGIAYTPNNVTISSIDIAFLDLVLFLVKLAIASIPAGIIFIIFYGILTGFLGLLGLGALLSTMF